MVTYRSGSQTQIVIGNELASGFNAVPGTPAGFVIRKGSFTIGGYKGLIEDNELRSDPNPARQETGIQEVSAQLVVPVTADEIGLFFYWFLTDYAVTGVGPYDHVFKIGSAAPLPLWVEVGDIELDKFDLYNGLVISGISLGTINKANNMLMATIDFAASGKYTKNGDDDQDAAPTSYTDRKHTMPLVTCKIDDSATTLINQMSYSLTRTVQMFDPLDGTLYMSGFDVGDYSIDCTLTGWRDTSDTIFGYDDGAEHGVEILSPRPGAATRYLSIDHNEAFIFDSETPGQVSSDEAIEATVRVKPTYIDVADASSVVVSVTNDVADYDAIMASA